MFTATILVEPKVNLKFRDATPDDVPVIAALARRHARVRVGREGKRILTVLRLATKKSWAIDVAYFTPVKRPLYLTGMTVAVTHRGYYDLLPR